MSSYCLLHIAHSTGGLAHLSLDVLAKAAEISPFGLCPGFINSLLDYKQQQQHKAMSTRPWPMQEVTVTWLGCPCPQCQAAQNCPTCEFAIPLCRAPKERCSNNRIQTQSWRSREKMEQGVPSAEPWAVCVPHCHRGCVCVPHSATATQAVSLQGSLLSDLPAQGSSPPSAHPAFSSFLPILQLQSPSCCWRAPRSC